MKNTMEVPQKTKELELLHAPSIPFLGIYKDNTIIQKDICAPMFTAELFKIAKTQKQPTATATVKSLQSCPILCDPVDGSPSGSPIPGILQARTLEWVAISFSNAWKWKVIVKSLSRVQLFTTPWTAAYQAPPSMGFSRQEYWSGVPLNVHQKMNGYGCGTYIQWNTTQPWKRMK